MRHTDIIGWAGVNFSTSCKTSQATATAWRQGGLPLTVPAVLKNRLQVGEDPPAFGLILLIQCLVFHAHVI